jgi:hypothetical protein
MAHRKPLGTTCRTVADWEGEHPTPGDYLVSPAVTWYRVLGVEEKANPKKVGLVLERIAPPPGLLGRPDGSGPLAVQDDDGTFHSVFEFAWYSRDRKRVA